MVGEDGEKAGRRNDLVMGLAFSCSFSLTLG